VAKECVLAGLAPQHESVAVLPFALRTRRNPRTCHQLLRNLTEWFAWLGSRDVVELGQVTQDHCEAYLAERSVSQPGPGRQPRPLAPLGVARHVFAMQTLALYGELFGADGYRPGSVPWGGRSSHEVLGIRHDRINKDSASAR
jgi:hypothetical protein